jgi:pentatricopeptide repeat protein
MGNKKQTRHQKLGKSVKRPACSCERVWNTVINCLVRVSKISKISRFFQKTRFLGKGTRGASSIGKEVVKEQASGPTHTTEHIANFLLGDLHSIHDFKTNFHIDYHLL